MKCYSKNIEFNQDYYHFLNFEKNITVKKYDTYFFKIEKEQIIIEWEDPIKLLRTIKNISEILYKKYRVEDIDFNFNIILSKELIKDQKSNHKGILIDDMNLWSLIKHSTMIIKDNKFDNFVIFEINFYSTLIYSETINLKTELGTLNLFIAKDTLNNKEYTVAYKNLDLSLAQDVRIHYQCETSEIFSSIHCDCREQLNLFLKHLHQQQNSILIYAHEEGRGIGLFNKINAYKLTEINNTNTVDATIDIFGKEEARNFEIPGDILLKMKVKNINLWTNNPLKIEPIKARRIIVEDRRIWIEGLSKEASNYTKCKIEKMNHIEKSLNK